jgi:hypothetical protein
MTVLQCFENGKSTVKMNVAIPLKTKDDCDGERVKTTVTAPRKSDEDTRIVFGHGTVKMTRAVIMEE